MILRPTLRFLTRPRPPADFAARRLAAVIRPPLLFFAMVKAPFGVNLRRLGMHSPSECTPDRLPSTCGLREGDGVVARQRHGGRAGQRAAEQCSIGSEADA